MRIEIDFKHQRGAELRNEFRTRTDHILRAVSWDLAFWLFINYHVTLLITCLCRDKTANNEAGGSPTSRHLEEPCRAVDYRTKDWPKEVLPAATRYLRDSWGDLLYVLVEPDHLHVQLSRKSFPDGSLKK